MKTDDNKVYIKATLFGKEILIPLQIDWLEDTVSDCFLSDGGECTIETFSDLLKDVADDIIKDDIVIHTEAFAEQYLKANYVECQEEYGYE